MQNSVDGVNPEIDEDFCDMTDDAKAVFLEVCDHGRSFIDVRYLTRACSALFQCVCRLASAVHGHMDTGVDEMEAEIALANELAEHAQKAIAEERHAAVAADVTLSAQRGSNLFGAASRS